MDRAGGRRIEKYKKEYNFAFSARLISHTNPTLHRGQRPRRFSFYLVHIYTYLIMQVNKIGNYTADVDLLSS